MLHSLTRLMNPFMWLNFVLDDFIAWLGMQIGRRRGEPRMRLNIDENGTMHTVDIPLMSLRER